MGAFQGASRIMRAHFQHTGLPGPAASEYSGASSWVIVGGLHHFAFSRTAVAAGQLHGRAFHRAVTTVDAAVSWLRLKHSVACFTFVEPLAGVGRHALGLAMTATRTSNRRLKNSICVHVVSLPELRVPGYAVSASRVLRNCGTVDLKWPPGKSEVEVSYRVSLENCQRPDNHRVGFRIKASPQRHLYHIAATPQYV